MPLAADTQAADRHGAALLVPDHLTLMLAEAFPGPDLLNLD